jgi:hypothetical protein
MAPVLSFLISSGSKKKEPKYVCLSEAEASLRLKILMTSGFKKGTRVYFSFLSKVPTNEPLQVPQQGPYGEGGPLTGHFPYLSKTSSFGFPSKCCIPSRWLEAGTPVLTERLVPEGDWYLARAGRLRIDIHDNNHDSFKVDIVDSFK